MPEPLNPLIAVGWLLFSFEEGVCSEVMVRLLIKVRKSLHIHICPYIVEIVPMLFFSSGKEQRATIITDRIIRNALRQWFLTLGSMDQRKDFSD